MAFDARGRLLVLGRIVAAAFAVFFGVGAGGHLCGRSVDPASPFGRLVRWGAGGEPQEVMLGVIYLALAVYLWRAVADPERHWLFIDFALAANVAHSAVMLFLSLVWADSIQHLWGDTLLTVLPTVVLALAWLPLRRSLALHGAA